MTAGVVLHELRRKFELSTSEVGQELGISGATYQKIERDQRDLKFVMAFKLCRLYVIAMEEFIALIDPQDLERPDFAVSRARDKRAQRKDR